MPHILIFCKSYYNRKAGKRLYASNYGKEAFCFRVPEEKFDPKRCKGATYRPEDSEDELNDEGDSSK